MGRRLRAAHRRIPRGGTALKLLDVTEFWSPSGGGVRTYLEAKARYLRNAPDVDHVLLVPGPRSREWMLHGTRVVEVAGPPAPASPGYHLLLRARRVRDFIRAEGPDVVELGSHYLAPWIVTPAARAAGSRLVGFYHTDVLGVTVTHGTAGMPGAVARPVARLATAYVRALYTRCDVVVASTRTSATGLRDLGLRVEVVPLGVDVDRFAPARRDPALRRRLQGGSGRPLLVFAGRLAREKELGTVLAGLGALHARTGARLVVAGEGHLRGRLRQFAARHRAMVAVLPYERDPDRLAALYASCDAYVAPGPFETFGLAAHEAMASGLPVISVDRGAVADVVRDGSCGALYRRGDPASFTAAAAALLAERRAPSAEARGAAEGRSWDRTFDALLPLYRSVPSGTSRRTPSAATASKVVSAAPAT